MARKTRRRTKSQAKNKALPVDEPCNYLCKLSDELLCHILSFLPLRDVVSLSIQNRKLYHAVQLYLRLCKVIDFTEGKLQAYMPHSISDNILSKLLKTCSKVEKILGLHPWQIEKRRQRNRKCLSIPGIIEALSSCEHLKGPIDAARYVPLAVALAKAPQLKHVEFIRVPFLGGLLQRVVEDHWQKNGFKKLKSIILGACSHLLETDIGFLMLASDSELENLKLQPSLSKDSLMLSLKLSTAQFNNLRELFIGFIDDFPPKGSWTNEELQVEGLADVVEIPCPITDAGLKIICQIFPQLEVLTINWCPHLLQPSTWTLQDGSTWNYLKDLILKKCHCLKLDDFVHFLSLLPSIEVVILEDMFYAPPNGCSHVGLSAGTGLGMSSAIISNQQNPLDIAENDNIDPINPAIPVAENNFIYEPGMHIIENNGQIAHNVSEDMDHMEVGNNAGISLRQGSFSGSNESGTAEVGNKHHESGVDSENENSSNNDSCLASSSPDISANPPLNANVNKESALRISEFDKPGTSGVGNSSSFVSCEHDDDLKFVDTACQVNVNDFKHSVKAGGSSSSSSSVQLSFNAPSATKIDNKKIMSKGNRKKSSNKLPRKSVCDKATSTSDPVFLEKPEQIIILISESLRSITFIACGITTVEISHCPKLQNIQVDVCSVFQAVKLKSCLQLSSLNITECPHAQFSQIVSEVKNLPARRNRTVYIKSKEENIKNDVAKVLFEDPECSYHVCILDNYYPTCDENVLNKQCFLQWMKYFHDINYDLIKKWGFTQTDKSSTSKRSYPWDKDVYCSNISCCDGEYEVVTDIPWLAELWVPYIPSWDFFYATYHPQMLGFKQYSDCYDRLKFCIAEQKELKSNLHLFMFSVYIQQSIVNEI